MKTITTILLTAFTSVSTLAQQQPKTAAQSHSGNIVTFTTSEKAPADFNAWTFNWTTPKRDTNTTLDCVVLDPNGHEYFRRDLSSAPPGRTARSDFMRGFAGGDPSVFYGQHIRIMFRCKGGKAEFDSLAKYSFEFRKVRPPEPARPGHFGGPINAAHILHEKKVYVVPTHEADPSAQESIHRFVRQVRHAFAKDAVVITDEEALKLPLTNEVVIAYGTWNGNAWLTQSLGSHPIKIERDRIVASREFPGTDLRLITAWPNPKNPQLGCVIYTAQRAEDILDMNSVFHGPTDYVIARGSQALKAGFYSKATAPWSLPPDDGSMDESYGAVIGQIQATVKAD